MKKEIFHNIEIPNGIEAEKNDNKIIIGCKRATKSEKKIINTNLSHIKNIIKGVQEKFEYKLKICYSHFPITVKVSKGEAVIKNFLGEKVDRKSKILDGVD